MNEFVSSFLTEAASVATSFGTILVNAANAVSSIVYGDDGITLIGSVLAMALGIGAVYLIFRMIRGLIKQNNRG